MNPQNKKPWVRFNARNGSSGMGGSFRRLYVILALLIFGLSFTAGWLASHRTIDNNRSGSSDQLSSTENIFFEAIANYGYKKTGRHRTRSTFRRSRTLGINI